MRRPNSRNIRPQLLDLEHRITPSYNLTVDNSLTTNVSVDDTTTPGVVVYTATDVGATVQMAEILAYLDGGNDVVIKTGDPGDGGAEDGTITWAADLDFSNSFGADPRLITLDTSAALSALASITVNTGVTLNGANLFGDGVLGFSFLSGGADVDLTGATVTAGRSLTVDAGPGDFTFDNITLVGDADLTAATIRAAGAGTLDSTGPSASVTLNGELDASVPTTITQDGGGTLSLGGGTAVKAVGGTDSLSLAAGTISILKPVDLTAGAAQSLTFNTGNVSFGANAISADSVVVGDNSIDDANFGEGTGIVTGSVTVNSNGNLTPGGVGAVGTLNIVGNVTIDAGGTYDPDFSGQTFDVLAITGDLTINGGLLGNRGTGAAPATANIVTYTGALVGTFGNAPLNSPALVGGDILQVTNYGSNPAGVITVTPVAAGPATVSGYDADGTAYKIKLSGPGELVVLPNAGSPVIIARKTTGASGLTITTTPNGSNAILAANRISVSAAAGATAALGTLTAGTTDVFNGLSVSGGSAKSVTLRDLSGPTMIGGATTDKTALKVRILGDATSTSALATLTATGTLTGTIMAPSLGAVTLGGAGDFLQPAILQATTGGIGSIKASGIVNNLNISTPLAIGTLTAGNLGGSINAASVGPVKITGNWNTTLTSAGAVGAITAGSISGTLTGASFGVIKVPGQFFATLTSAGVVGAITAGSIFGTLTGGSFGAITVASKFSGVLSSAGAVGAITAGSVADDFAGITLTGASFGAIKVTAGSFYGSLTATGAIASITVSGDFTGALTADSVGAVKTGGLISDDFNIPLAAWNVTRDVPSITAGAIGSLTFNARSLGSLTVTGNAARDLDANVQNSTFTLSGNNLGDNNNVAGFGVKTVTVAGNVVGTTFDIQNGSVMSFKAARFLDSKLYLNYNPVGDFDTTGAFATTNKFKLASFTTTATTLGDPLNPLNFSFANSEIAADTLGTVSFSGLNTDNTGTPFGVKFLTSVTGIKVLGVTQGNSGDFFVVDL